MKYLIFLTVIASSCRVNQVASGTVKTEATVKVEVTYPQCNRPEWSSDEVIRCIEAASSIDANINAPEVLTEVLTGPQDQPVYPTLVGGQND